MTKKGIAITVACVLVVGAAIGISSIWWSPKGKFVHNPMSNEKVLQALTMVNDDFAEQTNLAGVSYSTDEASIKRTSDVTFTPADPDFEFTYIPTTRPNVDYLSKFSDYIDNDFDKELMDISFTESGAMLDGYVDMALTLIKDDANFEQGIWYFDVLEHKTQNEEGTHTIDYIFGYHVNISSHDNTIFLLACDGHREAYMEMIIDYDFDTDD